MSADGQSSWGEALGEARLFGDETPTAVAVLLHGGPENSLQRPWPADPGRIRLAAFARAIRVSAARVRPAGDSHLPVPGRPFKLSVVRPHYEVRGWNGPAKSPVAGVGKLLDRIVAECGPVPVALVGHSMGGRIAAVLSGRPEVAVVVGLAPWWPDGDGRHFRPGQDVLVLHGLDDQVVDPASTRGQIEEVRGRGVAAEWIGMPGGHGMVRGWSKWHSLTADFVVSRLAQR